ncbi:hypothetical protein CCMA1212_004827 [Trichoderma ghanense]|uniref:Uncharacterized protein n=1 Tax=Trichoderma ghanense TaxID=65468 RepID=A0ABY2H6L3_9HYPO
MDKKERRKNSPQIVNQIGRQPASKVQEKRKPEPDGTKAQKKSKPASLKIEQEKRKNTNEELTNERKQEDRGVPEFFAKKSEKTCPPVDDEDEKK